MVTSNRQDRLNYAALGAAGLHLKRGTREAHPNKNDGLEVRRMLKNAGISEPAPWCAAFVQDCADAAAVATGLANPLDAVVHEAYVPSYYQWAVENGKVVKYSDVVPGDLVLFWNDALGRWAHIGFVVAKMSGDEFKSIEGNTNDEGSREGYEVALRLRKFKTGKTSFIRWAS